MRTEHRVATALPLALIIALTGHGGTGQTVSVPSLTDPPEIAKDYLDAVSLDSIGLIGPAASGLPVDLWHHSRADDLIALIGRQTSALPASLLDVFHVLMLVETPAPTTGRADGALLQARIDGLLALGAVDQAGALLGVVGPGHPALYPSWRDVALLTGTETRLCNRLLAQPSLTPALADHIYCHHALGKTEQARDLYEIALALDGLTPTSAAVLGLLFDPAGPAASLPGPENGNVLLTRILIDATNDATVLPDRVALAPLGLRETLPAPVQIAAIEALARSQSVSFAQALAVYRRTHWEPSNDGNSGIPQLLALDQTLLLGETAEGLAMLDGLFPSLAASGLLNAFADHYADALSATSSVSSLTQQIILALGGHYRACVCGPLVGGERDLAKLIRFSFGLPVEASGLAGVTMPALRAGLDGTVASQGLRDLVESGRHGEALLMAMTPFNDRDAVAPLHLQDAIALLVHYNESERARDLAVEWMAMEVLN